jgi:putative component of toxin-antitoxin plasmid stabilization module
MKLPIRARKKIEKLIAKLKAATATGDLAKVNAAIRELEIEIQPDEKFPRE